MTHSEKKGYKALYTQEVRVAFEKMAYIKCPSPQDDKWYRYF